MIRLMIGAVYFATIMSIGLWLHLRYATEQFVKSESLKQRDQDTVKIIDNLSDGIIVASKQEGPKDSYDPVFQNSIAEEMLKSQPAESTFEPFQAYFKYVPGQTLTGWLTTEHQQFTEETHDQSLLRRTNLWNIMQSNFDSDTLFIIEQAQ